MQILEQGLEERLKMTTMADELERTWYSRLSQEHTDNNHVQQQSIVNWLLGAERERFDSLTPEQLAIAEQAMTYRYRILQQRYLNTPPTQAYRNLINRLGSLVMLRNKIRTWVALSRDRRRAVADVIQEVIQEILNSDRYMQQQIAWIGKCTQDKRLREVLILATVEEYCLRPIRNQPLLVYRFVNFLRRSQRGGMTQVPQKEMVRLISQELTNDESESSINLFDFEAIASYQNQQTWEEQETLRHKVQQEFAAYLDENVSPLAAAWLQLYLQGRSQEAIAKILNQPIKAIYRLREKVSYHAIKVFAIKDAPELVANWLETSLKEHNFGLTPQEWQEYYQDLSPSQQELIKHLKAGKSLETIAQELNWKMNQVMGEWSRLYLAAQALRSSSTS